MSLDWELIAYTVGALRLDLEIAALKEVGDWHLPVVLRGADRSWAALSESVR